MRRDTMTVLALVGVTLALALLNIAGYPRFHEDEGTYTAQAWSILQGDLTPYTYWYDHPFVGWAQIGALTTVTGLFGDPSILNTRFAMLPYAAASAALLYVLARRLGVSRVFAGLSTLLWAASPLVALYNRQVFLDLVAVPWTLAAFVLAMSPRRTLLAHVGAGACFAIACLSKETVGILLPALLWILWQHSDPRTRSFSMTGFITIFALLGLSYPLFASLRKELTPGADRVSLWDALVFQMSRPSGGSLFEAGTAKNDVFQYWWNIDQVLITAGLAASVLLLLGPWKSLRPIGLVSVIGFVMAARPGWLPGMFVITFLPFLALSIGGLAHAIWRRAAREATNRTDSVLRTAGLTFVTLTGLCLMWMTGTAWAATYATEFSRDDNAAIRQASTWATASLDPARDVVMTDNTTWLDLVEAGWEAPFTVLWHVKLDTDVEAQEALPNGWKDVDYVISSYQLRTDVGPEGPGLPEAQKALINSTVVKTFGEGPYRVEVREVQE
jgi:uncharacterized protein YjeT (DUF2065 family)